MNKMILYFAVSFLRLSTSVYAMHKTDLQTKVRERYETPQARKISLGRRCLEHATVGLFLGAAVGMVNDDYEMMKKFSLLNFPTYPGYQAIRGYNDLDLRSGMPFIQNDARMIATAFSQFTGYVVGATSAIAFRSWGHEGKDE